MATIGLLINGPSMHVWYGFLHRQIPSQTTGAAITKVALDQAIFGPYVITGIFFLKFKLICSAFFTSNALMQGVPFSEAKDKLKKDFLPTMYANWTVWPAAMLINFKYPTLFLHHISFPSLFSDLFHLQ
jgi:hypothetical protein